MSLRQAEVYYDQQRYADARQALLSQLAEDPYDAGAGYLLALTLVKLEDFPGAHDRAKFLVDQYPEWKGGYLALAVVYQDSGRHKEAERAIVNAIQLDPEDSTLYEVQGGILLSRQKWKEALAAADQALDLDADSESALRCRSFALQMLGRTGEALEASATSLALDPDSADSLATHGMASLRKGDHKAAEELFAQALRQEPDNDFAREGLLQSLRSRFVPYKVVWQFSVWQARFPEPVRWGLWIGLWLGSRALRELGRSNPALLPLVIPVVAVYGIFVFFTWTAEMLANAALLFHPLGRHALERVEKLEAICAAVLTPLALIGVGGIIATMGSKFMLSAFIPAIALVLVGLSSYLRSVPVLRIGLVLLFGVLGVVGWVAFTAAEFLR